ETYNFHGPWRLNLLTAYDEALRSIILGLSSHLRYLQSDSHPTGAPLDVFGTSYPEAFPLGLDDGRDIHALKTDFAEESAQVRDSAFHFRSSKGRDNRTVEPAYANSYWWDIAYALTIASTAAQNAWGFQISNDGSVYTFDDPRSAGNGLCLINPNEDVPVDMMIQVESEFLRILGESFSNPGTGVLAGNITQTGFTWDNSNTNTSQIAAGSNTRGMEYALNDVRMSIFGSSALNFNNDDINGDINGDSSTDDDDAESTLNGWVDRIIPVAPSTRTHRRIFSWESPNKTRYRFIEQVLASATLAGYEWAGYEWKVLTQNDVDDIFLKHPLWLDAAWTNDSPIRPFSKTGRLTIDKARFYKAVTHCQVWNNLLEKRMSDVTSEIIYILDPNEDDDISDSHIQYRRTHRNLLTNE
ncbi:MAG: hypothetical protein HRU15_09445, partial [Planctomycetes bacterium]|nr:hypothetical protein [Planctomycetota bacterium]